MKRIIYFFLTVVTVVLTGCVGKNVASLKKFAVEITNLTDKTADIKVTAADATIWYGIEVMKAEDFFKLSAEDLHNKIDMLYTRAEFPELLHQNKDGYVLSCEELEAGTNYVVYIFEESEGYNLVGDVEWQIFTTAAPPEGSLQGTFTIDNLGTRVRFSKGNLQYQASTKTWRFADHQWDIIGDANNNISESYTGWIDLFGWGTGNNPTLSSDSYNDYNESFIDWGSHPISNGGNAADMWRTLSAYEWRYLFCNRYNAAKLFGMGSVNGVNGVILLPDNWQGEKFSDTENGLVLSEDGKAFYNNNSTNFSFHTYNASDWESMESNGAVFLPAAGARIRTQTSEIGMEGRYWSSNGSQAGGYQVAFNQEHLYVFWEWISYFGQSVRLVH